MRCSASLQILGVCVGVLAGVLGPICTGRAASGLPTPVAVAIAQTSMHKIKTRTLELYYPRHARKEALQVAQRLEHCAGQLRGLMKAPVSQDRLVVIVHGAEFNNAYVSFPMGGVPLEMVLPLHMSMEAFNFFDLGVTEIPQISCHEVVHAMVAQQTHGVWGAVNGVLGNVVAPTAFLDPWFHEGLATYYEAKLGGAFGRPKSPWWRGLLAAGVAGTQDHLKAGDLSALNRRMVLRGGAHYLMGMHFVEFLAQRYTEKRLWEWVDRQGDSILPVFGITGRFKAVYGQDIGDLFKAFTAHLQAEFPRRNRPVDQQVVYPKVGAVARLAVSPQDGRLAVISQGLDETTHIHVRDLQGRMYFSKPLRDVVPIRQHLVASVAQVSGLTFSADGRWIFVTLADLSPSGDFVSRLWQLDAQTGQTKASWGGIEGIGGSLHPAGSAYAYVRLERSEARLALLDLQTGQSHDLPLVAPEHAARMSSLGAPSFSPDGQDLAFVGRTPQGFNLFVRHADGALEQLTDDDAFNYAPRWWDAHRLIFLRSYQDPRQDPRQGSKQDPRQGLWQVHSLDLRTRAIQVLSDAPYAVFDAAPVLGDRIAFLNADGWDLSVDTIEASALIQAPAFSKPQAFSQTPAAFERSPVDPLKGPEMLAHETPLQIEEEGPYSSWDHLFKPTLRLPTYRFYKVDRQWHHILGMHLKGQDRLSQHIYALQLSYDTFLKRINFNGSYLNMQLAPWLGQLHVVSAHVPLLTERRLDVSLWRTFWSTQVGWSLTGLQYISPMQRLQRLGSMATVRYEATDTTPYGGVRRGLQMHLNTGFFPALDTQQDSFSFLRTGTTVIVPLPVSKRHSLRISGRFVGIFAAGPQLMEVGGTGAHLMPLYSSGPLAWGPPGPVCAQQPAPTPGSPEPGSPPSTDEMLFSEPVRGYESVRWRASKATTAEVAYHYPWVIDEGWHSLMYVLPSFFIRQMEMEVFGTFTASRSEIPYHRAVGASMTLVSMLGIIPLNVIYQFSYRFDQARGGSHWVGLVF